MKSYQLPCLILYVLLLLLLFFSKYIPFLSEQINHKLSIDNFNTLFFLCRRL